ncbi:MAG: hypothetical protein K9L74_01835 [Candidatus Izimaplasma sp.]|nr:hypothetical protein [Candidatus Izimaplasma bacterium]
MNNNFLEERLSFFNNKYQVITVIIIQFPFLFGWIQINNVESVLALNSLMFIFVGLLGSSLGLALSGFKKENPDKEVIDRIWFLKKNEIFSKASNYIINSIEDVQYGDYYKNMKSTWKNLYYKTTSEYWNSIFLTSKRDITKPSVWEIIKNVFFVLVITLFNQLYLSFDNGYVLFSMFVTVVMGGIYGYKVGKSIYFNKRILISKLLVLLCDQFILTEGLNYKPIEDEEKYSLHGYDIYKDKKVE